jgi:pimeloyl-ACP methyl ester carboxylesterase
MENPAKPILVRPKTLRTTRLLVVRLSILAVILIAGALLTESALEARDVAKYTPGQTFARVGDARIRYRMLGINRPGATVVILYGIGGSLEQVDQLQSAVSRDVPTLTYDRAGYGFSEGSVAHSAGDQADELAALLHSLMIEQPVVVAAFSDSNQVARVFAGRYPDKTAAVYLIDPWMPEFDVIYRYGPRSLFVRWVVASLVESSLGYTRLTQYWRRWEGPRSQVEQRAEAVLARRPHYWAMAREWYATSVSVRQTIEAPVPSTLPLEVVFPKPVPEDEISRVLAKFRVALVARSSGGKLVEVEPTDHDLLIKPGPVFDRMVARITQLSRAGGR